MSGTSFLKKDRKQVKHIMIALLWLIRAAAMAVCFVCGLFAPFTTGLWIVLTIGLGKWGPIQALAPLIIIIACWIVIFCATVAIVRIGAVRKKMERFDPRVPGDTTPISWQLSMPVKK